MKAIVSVVMSSAAIMRSPSFSRSVESSTTMNSPPRKAAMVSSMLSKRSFETPLTDMQTLQSSTDAVEGKIGIRDAFGVVGIGRETVGVPVPVDCF